MGAEASHQPGEYQEPELPSGVLEVRISVYKLELTGVGFLDQLGASLAGAYHSGLVVAGQEWAYGGHDLVGKSGVYSTKPELNQDYIFYQRVVVGQVHSTPKEVAQTIRRIASHEKWTGVNYELVEQNCNHFVSDLCWALLKKRSPAWINSTADSIALQRRLVRVKSDLLERALAEYRAEFGTPVQTSSQRTGTAGTASASAAGAGGQGDTQAVNGKATQPPAAEPSVPGAKAFEDAFGATFELVWSRRFRELRAMAASSAASGAPIEAVPPQAEGEEPSDPEARQRLAERDAFTEAGAAAHAAARVVATAARLAAEARAAQPEEGLVAWDARWISESSSLLRRWREEAAAGRLDSSRDSAQGAEREAQVSTALEAAAEAAARTAQRSSQQRSSAATAAEKSSSSAGVVSYSN